MKLIGIISGGALLGAILVLIDRSNIFYICLFAILMGVIHYLSAASKKAPKSEIEDKNP